MFRRWVTASTVAATLLIMPSRVGAARQFLTIGPAFAAPRWTALYDRTSGWTGADGIYSIPLSGNYAPGRTGPNAQTYVSFNDTFIGQVNSNGSRAPGTQLVHNTYAQLQGPDPDPARISFHWNTDSKGNPQPVFVPSTPDSKRGDWYWPNDGVSSKGTMSLFALRMEMGNGGPFNFKTAGVSLIQWPVRDPNPSAGATQMDTPLHVAGTTHKGEIDFGGWVMPNTLQGGAPHPDGYVYIYGVRSDSSTKKLLVARVPPLSLTNFGRWRYWNGITWLPSITASAPMAPRTSQEFSVTPLSDGHYLLVFQLDTLSKYTAYSLGQSPTGPWGNPVVIWHCKEASEYPQAYCYNAKAHPSLSQAGELLISYNVNSFSFVANLQYAGIYHPRFITLPVSTFR